MQQLLGYHLDTVPDSYAVRNELFLQRLPGKIRMVLASADDATDLQKLAVNTIDTHKCKLGTGHSLLEHLR
jgi:hypothetical protein